MNWHCPLCGFRRTTDDEIVRIQHTCPQNAGELIQLERGTPVYDLYCGRCRELLPVCTEDIPDGEVWVCDECQAQEIAS